MYFITGKSVMDRFEGSWVYETAALPPEHSDTIPALAEKLGLDPAKLEETVSEFNAACGSGDWDPVEMDDKETSGITPPKSNWANPIVEAPFSGFPMTAPFFVLPDLISGRLHQEEGLEHRCW